VKWFRYWNILWRRVLGRASKETTTLTNTSPRRRQYEEGIIENLDATATEVIRSGLVGCGKLQRKDSRSIG